MFIIRGITNEGKEVFYTGKAGEWFANPIKGEAFTYETKEAAQRKAVMFNHNTFLHGIHFIAMEA